jgi:hypothetical protein
MAAVAASSAMAPSATLAAVAVAAGRIEQGRTADGVDQVSAGGGCDGRRGHRRSNEHPGGRAESGDTTAMS